LVFESSFTMCFLLKMQSRLRPMEKGLDMMSPVTRSPATYTTRSPSPAYSDEKVANRDARDFGWGIAHGAVVTTPADSPLQGGTPYRKLPLLLSQRKLFVSQRKLLTSQRERAPGCESMVSSGMNAAEEALRVTEEALDNLRGSAHRDASPW
jgi:hypothetical protein